MKTEIRRGLAGPALAAAAIVVTAATQQNRPDTGRRAPLEGKSRVLSVAKKYLYAVNALIRPMTLAVESMDVPTPGCPAGRYWLVECEDAAGRYAGILIIDAVRDRIVGANIPPRGESARPPEPMSRQTAIGVAVQAARNLVPEFKGARATLAEPTESNGKQWFVSFRSRAATATVGLDAATGGIISLSVKYPGMTARNRRQIARL